MKANKGAPGIDGITIEMFPAESRKVWDSVRYQLQKGIYRPQPVLRVEIPKPGGGKRPLGIPTVNGQLDDLSAEVRFDEAHDGLKLMTLNYEKKRFLDCIKVFTCNLNEAMCRMLLKYYDRRKEILPALSMIVERAEEVKLEDGEIRVRLRGFKNPEIDYAARRLREDLNGMDPRTLDRFRIPLRYEIA